MKLSVVECGGKGQETVKTIPDMNALEMTYRKLTHKGVKSY